MTNNASLRDHPDGTFWNPSSPRSASCGPVVLAGHNVCGLLKHTVGIVTQ